MMSIKLHTRQLMGSLLCLLLLSAGLVAQQGDGERFSALIKNVRVNGVELHYLESGSGISVVLIHGGLGDYPRVELADVSAATTELSPIAGATTIPMPTPRFRLITQRLLKLGTSPHCSTRSNWSASTSSVTPMAP